MHEHVHKQVALEARRAVTQFAAKYGTKGEDNTQNGNTTVLAAIVVAMRGDTDKDAPFYKVLSIGAGCRSVGHQKVVAELNKSLGPVRSGRTTTAVGSFINAFILHDGHAEVMARRAFVAYVIAEMEALMQMLESSKVENWDMRISSIQEHVQNDSNFILQPIVSSGRVVFALKPSVEGLYLWSSQMFCGDCSIVINQQGEAVAGTGAHVLVPQKDREAYRAVVAAEVGAESSPTLTDDASYIAPHFCTKCSQKDNNYPSPRCPWLSNDHESPAPLCAYPYQQTAIGYSRTKPGAGIPTLSMSCTDKVRRWLDEGLGGNSLATLLHEGTLPLQGVIVEKATKGSIQGQHESLVRGLRCDKNLCSISFEDDTIAGSTSSFLPSTSILWHARGADDVVRLNTKVGIPMGVTSGSVVKSLKDCLRKREREEEGAEDANPSIAMGNVPSLLAHFGTRFSVAKRIIALLTRVNLLSQVQITIPTTYLGLKRLSGKGDRCRRELTKSANRDFFVQVCDT